MLLRNLWRRLSRTDDGGRSAQRTPQVVLYARFATTAATDKEPPAFLPDKTSLPQLSPSISHRARVLSMRLEHLQLCSLPRCRRLQQLGVVTAGDLALASPRSLAEKFRAARRAERVLSQYRRAIRLAASVPGMMPRDALLLVSVHRRSVPGIARESAAALHRDLQRYAESSSGRTQLRGRRIPSHRRLKRWIQECRQLATPTPV